MKTKVIYMINNQFRRKLTSQELLLRNHPVIIAGTLNGKLLPLDVQNAIQEIQKKHILLRVKIEKIDNQYYFLEDSNIEIPFITGEYAEDGNWIRSIQLLIKKSFNFQKSPLLQIVFLKSQSHNQVKLILIADHAICDGKSVVYLLKDILLSIEGEKIGFLMHPPEMKENMFPKNARLNSIEKFVLKKMNAKWKDQKILFDQQDFECIFEGFWKNINYEINVLEFNQTDTQNLISYCKQNHISVNSFITAVILRAHLEILGNQDEYYGNINTAVNVREYTKPKISEHLGLYARGIDISYKYDLNQTFIKNVKVIQEKVRKNLTMKNLFKPFLLLNNLSHGLNEALMVKKLGKYASEEHSRYEKIMSFVKQEDMVKKLIKKKESDKISKNFIITNIGKLDLKINYSRFNLESVHFIPPCSFIAKQVIGVATVNKRLILNFSNYEHITSTKSTIAIIKKIKTLIKTLNFD
ncbi:hypothetical protein WKT22_00255 [Candidatus Lokiarchaeum ossiferum]